MRLYKKERFFTKNNIFTRVCNSKISQHLLEYLLVIAIASAAAIAMHTYIMRAARGVVKTIERKAFK